jgi:NADH:ubiquinone oxidoreductase subunit C
MDDLSSRLNSVASGLIIEKAKFGRAAVLTVWVETKNLRKLAEKALTELGLDWLENFQIAQLEGVFVVTYWLRSYSSASQLVIRCSVEQAKSKKDVEIDLPSVRDLWPMAAPFENEAGELFGVSYSLGDTTIVTPRNLLPESVKGFPLREAAK